MHSKCQEMATDRMCSFILPSQPDLLDVPAAYGELLRAELRHILTQDRFELNLYDNNFLFKLRETQGDGMRQMGKIEGSISFFPHTVLVGRHFLLVSVSGNPLAERIATNFAQAPASPGSSIFHHLEPWLCLLLLANSCLSTRLLQFWGLCPLLPAMPLTLKSFWLWLCRERLGPSLQTVQLSLAVPLSEKNIT